MALVQAPPESSDVKLMLALRDYETSLSVEEKIKIRSEGVPDTGAVIRLTKIIDDQRHENQRRCMGPRLTLFLESVQQFSAVVGTFVSSHPETAALVWGGVKLTLLVISNRDDPGMTTNGCE